MMGKRVMAEPLFYTFRLEDHVPADHSLRAVDALLDTAFVRRVMAPHYSAIGRPSIDPELMIRMLLVGYLGGIRSERKLCAEVHLNLAHRWFCRLGLDGSVPDHSTFSKNRHNRFRNGDVFRAVFEEVVRRCAEAGLVPGEGAAVDGSQVEADASRHRRLPGGSVPEAWAADREAQTRPVREYLDALDAAAPPAEDEPRHGAPKYLSATDPAAAWGNKHGMGVFAYETNLLVDTAHGIIVDVDATPARLSQEIVAAKTMLKRAKEAFGFAPNCPSGGSATRCFADGSRERWCRWELRHGAVPDLAAGPRRGPSHPGAGSHGADGRHVHARELYLRGSGGRLALPVRAHAAPCRAGSFHRHAEIHGTGGRLRSLLPQASVHDRQGARGQR